MDKFHAMQVFTRVVEANSFSRASDSLNLPRGSVTRIVKDLEAFLKIRLLNRTTRSLSLTSEGAAYYERCVRILSEVEQAEGELTTDTRTPRGKLRVDMSGALGKLVVVPALDDFQARFSDIDLSIGFGDRFVDLVQEGIDCVIRVGALGDSTLVARRIGTYHLVTVASPGYLERRGTPRSPDDLEQHVAVNYVSSRTGRAINLNFIVDGERVNIRMRSRLAINDGDAHIQCAIKGLGLVQVPRLLALPYLASGELVEVLPDFRPPSLPISAVYPHSRHLSPPVRAFVDWVAELFAACPGVSADTGMELPPDSPVRARQVSIA
ncbi:LysR family transcriptional regulator [Cupriavidus pampae]|uniref:HTH-type transcriptional regulator PgrR n=1 Tax=Cupriavidus pampae TaxID=659251 RepID=A0ABN7XW75_9BURK|nr:LysR family transcriptional regulator [Cupriavidus pampae]CAG9164333.1 HTH-type transcriptional regulator PgrR [Cupriavidus pampae]